MNNRILAMLLVIVMVISMVPVMSLAEETHTCFDDNGNCVCDYAGCSEKVHKLTKYEAVEVTCTTDGSKEYYYCTNCNTAFMDEAATVEGTWTEDIVIKAEGHVLVRTSLEDGTHKVTCENCDHTEGPYACKDVENGGDCVCDYCGYHLPHKDEKKADGTAGNDCLCDVCGTGLEHEVQAGWSCNDEGHYHLCAKCKTQVTSTESHKLQWIDNGDEHYQKCEECLRIIESTREAHTYERTTLEGGKHETKCSKCGHVMGTYTCEDSAADDDCVCDGCGGAVAHDIAKDMTKVYKPATCTEDGIKGHYECDFCGLKMNSSGKVLTDADVHVPAPGHKENAGWSCNDEGHYRRCSVCNEIVTEVFDHNLVYATLGDGTHSVKCGDCARTFDAEPHEDTDTDCVCDKCEVPLPHQPVRNTGSAATCEDDGVKWHYQCSVCDKYFWDEACTSETTSEAVIIPALGHDWQNIGMLNGKHLQQCSICNAYQTVDHLDENSDCLCDWCGNLVHSHALIHAEDTQPTCTEDGHGEYWYYEGCGKEFADAEGTRPLSQKIIYKATGHDFYGEWFDNGDGTHVQKCQNAGCDAVSEGEAHSNKYNTNGSGCYCDICAGLMHSHELVEVPYQAPTCTDAGQEAYWYSEGCDVMFADAEGTIRIESPAVIPALGHELSGWIDNGDGFSHERICLREGCGHSQNLEYHVNVNADCFCDRCGGVINGHEVEFLPHIPATCEEDGAVACEYCAGCDQYYIDGEAVSAEEIIIPAYGHFWSDELINDKREGNHYQRCLNGCGEVLSSDHQYTLEDPLKGNYHQWICDCGATETEIHYNNDGDNVCDECGHDLAETPLDVKHHGSATIIVGDKSSNKKDSWWENWWNNMIPSYVGEAESNGSSESVQTGSGTDPVPSGSTVESAAPSGSEGVTSSFASFFQWLAGVVSSWLG